MAEMQPLPEEQNGRPDRYCVLDRFTETSIVQGVENTIRKRPWYLDDLIGEMRPFHPWLKHWQDLTIMISIADHYRDGDIALL